MGPSNTMIIREFQFEDADMVIELWKQCGLLRPWNHPILDIKRKQTRDRDLFLVGVESEKIVASVMGGYEGHRGWINYLAVDLSMRKKGFGRMILEEVERRLKEKGAPKINLQVRRDNTDVIEFYKSVGYEIDEVISLGKRLIQDPPWSPPGKF